MMTGIRRGLYSNEAGQGTVPNASAATHCRHPVEQGFVQAAGVYVDTFIICTATAFIVLLNLAWVETPYSLDDVMSVMRNQKAKVFDEFVIPTEATKQQNELYKLLGVKPELSITR